MQILHSVFLGHRGVTRTFAALLWLLQLMATNAYKGSHTHTHTYHQNQLSCESHGFAAWEPEKKWSAAVLSVFLFVVVPAWWVRAVPCLPLR